MNAYHYFNGFKLIIPGPHTSTKWTLETARVRSRAMAFQGQMVL